jgi:hypothetical protein
MDTRDLKTLLEKNLTEAEKIKIGLEKKKAQRNVEKTVELVEEKLKQQKQEIVAEIEKIKNESQKTGDSLNVKLEESTQSLLGETQKVLEEVKDSNSQLFDNISSQIEEKIASVDSKQVLVDLKQTIQSDNKDANQIRELQTGKLAQVERYGKKQTDELQEQSRILRETKAEVVDGNKQTNSTLLTQLEAINQIYGFLITNIKEKKEIDLKKVEDFLESSKNVLLNTWNPEDKALNVIVKNQVQPISGGGGIIPFSNSGNFTDKALLDDSRRLVISPDTAITVNSFQPQYAVRVDETGLTITYVGEANPGSTTNTSAWRIKRIYSVGTSITNIEWANGGASFNQVWDNRSGLTYF